MVNKYTTVLDCALWLLSIISSTIVKALSANCLMINKSPFRFMHTQTLNEIQDRIEDLL